MAEVKVDKFLNTSRTKEAPLSRMPKADTRITTVAVLKHYLLWHTTQITGNTALISKTLPDVPRMFMMCFTTSKNAKVNY